jgi:glycerol-3-phosphate dehydrogenase subunit C
MDDRFKCCGSPLVVGGYLDEARSHADNNVAIINEYAAKNIPVIACCTSCSLMLKAEYTELFAQEEMAQAAKNVYDAFEFLTILAEKGELKKVHVSSDKKFIYHAPCHLRAQGMGMPAVDLLKEIGVNIDSADAGCCGMSGSYGFHKENYETSMKIGSELFDKINASGAHKVVCDCGTCREQIKHGTNAKTTHPIQVLAKAYEQ